MRRRELLRLFVLSPLAALPVLSKNETEDKAWAMNFRDMNEMIFYWSNNQMRALYIHDGVSWSTVDVT